MALSTTTVQPVSDLPATSVSHGNDAAAPLLATLLLTVFAAQKSKKQLRQLKRKAIIALLKYKLMEPFVKVKNLFSKNKQAGISNTTLLYILLGLLVLILIFVEPIVAIAVLLLGILLILLTR